MLLFLSDEWLAAVDEALRADPTVAAAAPATPLVVQHTVLADRAGPHAGVSRAYHLVLGATERAAVAGPASRPDVTFTLDRTTALDVARGHRNAAQSVLTGCLRTGGDLRLVLAHRELFAAVDAALAPVRGRTTYRPA